MTPAEFESHEIDLIEQLADHFENSGRSFQIKNIRNYDELGSSTVRRAISKLASLGFIKYQSRAIVVLLPKLVEAAAQLREQRSSKAEPALGATPDEAVEPPARWEMQTPPVEMDFGSPAVGREAVFDRTRAIIDSRIADPVAKTLLLERVEQLETAAEGPGFLDAYKRFVQQAADHMSELAPILPELAALLR